MGLHWGDRVHEHIKDEEETNYVIRDPTPPRTPLNKSDEKIGIAKKGRGNNNKNKCDKAYGKEDAKKQVTTRNDNKEKNGNIEDSQNEAKVEKFSPKTIMRHIGKEMH